MDSYEFDIDGRELTGEQYLAAIFDRCKELALAHKILHRVIVCGRNGIGLDPLHASMVPDHTLVPQLVGTMAEVAVGMLTDPESWL